MGDAMDALEMLLGPDGMDHGRLSEAEQQNNDISSHAYTDHDRRVLRHWEGAAQPAKRLCKFLQDDNDAYTQLSLSIVLPYRIHQLLPSPFLLTSRGWTVQRIFAIVGTRLSW